MATRTLMLAAALGLSGALLAGCGDDSGDADETTQNGETTSQEQASEGNSGNGESGEDGTQTASADAVSLIFGTGGTGGTYYPIGGALKSVFEASDLVDDVQVVSTGASVRRTPSRESCDAMWCISYGPRRLLYRLSFAPAVLYCGTVLALVRKERLTRLVSR